MQAVQTAEPPATPEEIWAILREVGRKQEETARQMEKNEREREKTEREIEKTERILKENIIEFNRRIGHLDNLFGEVAEYMIAPKLGEKFRELGLDFPDTSRNSYINDVGNNIFLEIDVRLENGEKVMLVEVKTKLTVERINKHIERLEKMRKYADLRGDKRTFLGAVAGVVVTDDVRKYALEQGFYLVEPSGDSFNITPPEGKAKEW